MQPEDGTGYLQTIAPRKNSLIRPAVANLDLVVAVASAAPPVTDPFLIDKVTAIAVHKEMHALVVINKTDADRATSCMRPTAGAASRCCA